ncbi:MAG: PhzF family phenazine biosynthesis protein [Defluviitaleaceae bacterium]|nr:PhzF family phenazine biosynthesis protein [Defluviitaleaceae bacterium]
MEYHVIDAFTDKLFGGNPAGVCLPDSRLPDDIMQSIAAENNLSETAFLVKQANGKYGLRWFTPTLEIDLCGHATLASAFVLFGEREKDARELKFDTASGELTVTRDGELLCLNFPSTPAVECPAYPSIERALGIKPLAVYKSIDFMVLVKDEKTLRRLNPVFAVLGQLKSEAGLEHDRFGIIVTAPGAECDFVSRYFAPSAGVPEDPVTGRAHCTLTPYWRKQLGKKVMEARQLSARGGVLRCEDCGKRVKISGKAVRYLKGEIEIKTI